MALQQSCLNLKNSYFEGTKTNTYSNLGSNVSKSIKLRWQTKTCSKLAIKPPRKVMDLVQSSKNIQVQYQIWCLHC